MRDLLCQNRSLLQQLWYLLQLWRLLRQLRILLNQLRNLIRELRRLLRNLMSVLNQLRNLLSDLLQNRIAQWTRLSHRIAIPGLRRYLWREGSLPKRGKLPEARRLSLETKIR